MGQNETKIFAVTYIMKIIIASLCVCNSALISYQPISYPTPPIKAYMSYWVGIDRAGYSKPTKPAIKSLITVRLSKQIQPRPVAYLGGDSAMAPSDQETWDGRPL